MKYKKYQIECDKNYLARLFICPESRAEFDFVLHWHRDIEFIYVEKGPLTLLKLDKEIKFKDNSMYFINSEEIHSYTDIASDSKLMVVNIPIRALLPFLEIPNELITFDINKLNDRLRSRMTELLYKLINVPNRNSKASNLLIKALLNEMAYILIENCICEDMDYVRGGNTEEFSCAKSAVLYMEKNFKEDITLTEISSYVGMTPAHFSKYFKEKTEVTFSRYLRKIRLEHALSDLLRKNMSVSAVAIENGFPNVNSFISFCKSEYGRTPLEMKVFQKT